ncbi:MAG: glycosyl hydrolase 108 family protein [Pseudomonadota bacterium]
MSQTAFDRAVEHVFKVEGGFDHAADDGAGGKYGIAQSEFDAWRASSGRAQANVADLTIDEAREIYKETYWDKLRGGDMPEAVSLIVMDAAAEHGNNRAIKLLQKSLNALGANPKLRVDGLIGPRTLGALEGFSVGRVLDEFVVKRGLHYVRRPSFDLFGLDWARRLVSSARAAYGLFDRQSIASPTSMAAVAPPAEVKRYFYESTQGQTYGTFFRLWGGWATAAHVIEEMDDLVPPFANGSLQIRPAQYDAAFMGVQVPPAPPPEPARGMAVTAVGFPAGALTSSHRQSRVYLKRPGNGPQVWIAEVLSPEEPVVVGMSGGMVFETATGRIIGIIVHRNSPADLDRDGDLDQTFDFVALSDVYRELANPGGGAMV